MTYRKSPQKIASSRAWDSFVTSNEPIIAATGIPESVFRSVDRFDDFLSHGSLEHHTDPSNSRVEALSGDQYSALVTLVESYFAAGYEWFTPAVLRPVDQDALARRFAT